MGRDPWGETRETWMEVRGGDRSDRLSVKEQQLKSLLAISAISALLRIRETNTSEITSVPCRFWYLLLTGACK